MIDTSSQPIQSPNGAAAAKPAPQPDPQETREWLDALDGVTAVGLGKANSGVRTAEAYVRGRQNADGLWYPGAPVKNDGLSKLAAAAANPNAREGARWLTVRVLIVLRRVN